MIWPRGGERRVGLDLICGLRGRAAPLPDSLHVHVRCPRKLTFSVLGVAVLLPVLLNPTPTTAVQSVESATVPDTAVVGSGDVSATVSTSPFGLSFRDSRDREVLSSVPGGGVPTAFAASSANFGTYSPRLRDRCFTHIPGSAISANEQELPRSRRWTVLDTQRT